MTAEIRQDRACATLIALFLAGAVVQAARLPAQSVRTQFRATTSIVRLDVIVRDSGGRFVRGLGADDFRVFEDDVEQEVLGAQLIDLRTDATRPGGGEGRSRTVDVEGSDERTPGVTGALLFLVDMSGLEEKGYQKFLQALGAVLEGEGALSIPTALHFYRFPAGIVAETSLTRDPVELLETVERMATRGAVSSVRSRLLGVARSLPADPFSVRAFAGEERGRALQVIGLLGIASNALRSRPGRKAVVWVSGGISNTWAGPLEAVVRGEDQLALLGSDPVLAGADSPASLSMLDQASSDGRVTDALDELWRVANSANVSVYALDPTPVADLRSAALDVTVRNPEQAAAIGSSNVQDALEQLRQPLRDTASRTGGEAFIHWTELSDALKTIRRDNEQYYLLSYRAPEPVGDGDYHRIRVDVDLRDAEVTARVGYVDVPADEAEATRLTAALHMPGLHEDGSLRAQAFRSWREDGTVDVVLVTRAVEASVEGESERAVGATGSAARLHAIVIDRAADRVVEELSSEFVRAGLPRRDETPVVTRESSALFFPVEFDLAPGTYDVRLVLERVTDGLFRATRFDLDIPQRQGWIVNDPVLWRISRDGQARPVIAGAIEAGAPVEVRVEALGADDPVLSGRILTDSHGSPEPGREPSETSPPSAEADDQAVSSSRLEIGPVRMKWVSDSRSHRGGLTLPADLPPGSYLLQLNITDPAANRYEILRLPLEIVP